LKKDRCIIIPSYNEARNIASVICDIRKFHGGDIVVIDDGSQDMTSSVARQAGALVIRHPFNMGAGVALQTGYKYATIQNYGFLVQMDGDGQHPANCIPELFNQVEDAGYDVAIGSRFLAESQYKVGILKTIGIHFFRRIIQWVIGQKITDPTSGYRCLNRRAFEFLTNDRFPYDYPDANVIIMLHRANLKIKEIPVEMKPNPEGRSMHRGLPTISYYFFRVILSILVSLVGRERPRSRK
jgi:glycosyltransferase involved in cell wall biosynthesis